MRVALIVAAEAPPWAHQLARDIEDKIVLESNSRATTPLNPMRVTLAKLPDPVRFAGCYVSVTDATGGPAWCYSDGADWCRDRDNTVVS